MKASNSKRVKKPWTERRSLVQMRYRRKGTLRRMLYSYFDDCRCKGVYLLIHEDNRYFTVNFNKSDSSIHFPPSDKDIVSDIQYNSGKMQLLQKQEMHYPPPSRTTCENYMEYQNSREVKGEKQGKLENKH
ncbi:predicted protein [Histoplasma capsulatum G186AR]|uniref:Uncharacterized protein n=1 Tax=Ajellomyces capsulatus (strain G186AR / H82 / ATCC MYA-2454 / RMSCC 2432) TaxID=447093 RepID=C0NVU3_AJECG|nr:uncharacterized protein HCBG_07273 [Histoplasma capsulatum G186AR]EEH04632.1 predicted protein [Histoplasma capsulatum G186AR]